MSAWFGPARFMLRTIMMCVLLCAGTAGYGDFQDCDLLIRELPVDQNTVDEPGAALIDELADRIRRFDECVSQLKLAAGGGGGDGDGDGTEGQGLTGNAKLSENTENTDERNDPAGEQQSLDGSRQLETQQPETPELDQTDVTVTSFRQYEAEDNIAQMLGEAAEQETDPVRRKALVEQYEEYLNAN